MRKSRKSKTEDSSPKSGNPNLGRKFVIFVKPCDEFGFVEEDKCGWLRFCRDNTPVTTFSFLDGKVFEEKEHGHGSFEDWKRFLEEEHPNWKICSPPKYLD